MDQFVPLEAVDHSFDSKAIFSQPFSQMKASLKQYLLNLIKTKEPSTFMMLFDQLTSTDVEQKNIEGYYDQPHAIRDIKTNIGITPLELIRRYK